MKVMCIKQADGCPSEDQITVGDTYNSIYEYICQCGCDQPFYRLQERDYYNGYRVDLFALCDSDIEENVESVNQVHPLMDGIVKSMFKGLK